MPPEDSILDGKNVYAVGDGITRDPSYDGDFKKRSLEKILADYPNPSGARCAADIFCETFVEAGDDCADPTEIKERFIKANGRIARLNRKSLKKVDYLVNDFYGCAAAGAVISEEKLCWGVIADCGVIIYSKTGKLKFQSPNSMTTFERFTAEGKIKFKWETQEGRRLVRSQYRNNASQMIDGTCASYGALTGEKTAETFMLCGMENIVKGDLILVYSDGFEPTLKHPDFFKTTYNKSINIFEQKLVPFNLKLAQEKYEKFGKERSLLALIH
ncbi:MAG: hypothetical protein WC551_01455 [Patescibacteria group bacterium]